MADPILPSPHPFKLSERLFERAARQGKPLKHVASVASFFLSRIDVLVDPMLETIAQARGAKVDLVTRLHGQVAIASARVARQIYREIFLSERFQKLVNQGARSQRLLWASTSTKNPAYPDLKYVEPLIGPETINTLPLETLGAYRDHGEPEARLDQDGEQARGALQQLPELGINIDQVTQQLEDEGVEKFNRAFDKLINALSEKSVLPLTSP